MNTTAEKLNKLRDTKEAIRIAINNKGGTLTESNKFSDYATAIDELKSGGGLIEVNALPENKYDTTSVYTFPYKFNDILISVKFQADDSEALLFSKVAASEEMPISGCEVIDSLDSIPTDSIVETGPASGYYFYYSISDNEVYIHNENFPGGWMAMSAYFAETFNGVLMPCKGVVSSQSSDILLGHGYYIVNTNDYYKYFNNWEEITYSGDGSDLIDSGYDLPKKDIDKDKVYKVKYFDDIYMVLEEGKSGSYLTGMRIICGIDVCEDFPTKNLVSPSSDGTYQHFYYIKNNGLYAYTDSDEGKRFVSFDEAYGVPFKGEVDKNNNDNNTTRGVYAVYTYKYYRNTSASKKLKYNSKELDVAPSTESQEFEAVGNDYYSRVTVKPVTSNIDTNILPENIAKDVTILGVTGTFEGGIPGVDYYEYASTNKYALDVMAKDANLSTIDITPSAENDIAVNIFATEATTNLTLSGGSNGDLTGTVNIVDTDYTGSVVADNLVPENIRIGTTILGVTGTMQDVISVDSAKDAINTEAIQTLDAVPENPTSESLSIIKVDGVIYVLTNTEGENNYGI